MSNRLFITPTKFVDVQSNEEHFGFRAFDDYEQTYDNTWDSVPTDDLAFLQKVVTCAEDNSILHAMLYHLFEFKDGVYIGSHWYDFDKIRDIIKPEDK